MRSHLLVSIGVISKSIVQLIAILTITVVHYVTDPTEGFFHIILRELYFIPIIVAGFWFGLKGGLAVAAIISLLYFPVAVGGLRNIGEHQFGNLLEILLFSVIGALVGWLQDRELRRQTEQRQEEALIKTGKAVSCIAHDMKTPLMAIGGFAIQLRKSIETDSTVRKKLEIIIHQTKRLEKMVQDMLKFAQPLELEYESIDLTSFLEETRHLIQEKALSHKIKLSVVKSSNVSIYQFDYHRLQQALINLLNNAIEASPRNGKVILRCNCRQENKYLCFEIEDFGEGLQGIEDNAIFEPFITSKKDGTGLGLSIVKKIIEAHGGILEYEMKSDQGTIFRMLLGSHPASAKDQKRFLRQDAESQIS